MESFLYEGQTLGCEEIIALTGKKLQLSPAVIDRIRANRNSLEDLINEPGSRYYGINTGFGSLYTITVSPADIRQLQTNLLRSHACGVGPAAPAHIVRLTLLLKILSLSQGYSGVRPEVVLRLTDLYNLDILPVVPTMGSLGASGDLAPLAHLTLPLIGEGEVVYKREQMPALNAWHRAGIDPIKLEAKEGLALINGTQYSLAWLLYAVYQGQKLSGIADMCAAMSMDGYDCHPSPLDERIHQVRNQPGQIVAAASIRKWMEGSALTKAGKAHLQDPYSFRCAPQVHGATRDVLQFAATIADHEINAVTDNPLVFNGDEKVTVLSGGNFHAQPLALWSDYLAIALSELGSISERRSYLLLSGQRNLPPSLAKNPGLESGYMICQYTAAAVVNRNKVLAHPASVDTIVTSAGQEDHVSMAATAGIKLYEIVQNTWKILAIEWMIACQALENRRPLKTSDALEDIHAAYRQVVPALKGDRQYAGDIDATESFLRRISL